MTATHVAGAETDDGAVFDRSRDVALRGDGVEVAREHDLRPPTPYQSVSSSSHAGGPTASRT